MKSNHRVSLAVIHHPLVDYYNDDRQTHLIENPPEYDIFRVQMLNANHPYSVPFVYYCIKLWNRQGRVIDS